MIKRLDVASDLKNVDKMGKKIVEILKKAKIDESDVFDLRLSLEEALVNAIKYGNKLDSSINVSIDLSVDNKKVTISVEDCGEGFDHQGLPNPTQENNLLKPRGRGVFLIKHLMDLVKYNKKGNRVTMTKYLKNKAPTKKKEMV
ncbi:ATP-binding protein [Candidatus Omnitrophota bacterium]